MMTERQQRWRKLTNLSAGFRLLLAVFAGMSVLAGCQARDNPALAPENVLEYAFRKDPQTAGAALGIDWTADASPIGISAKDYMVERPVEIDGETARRVEFYFMQDQLVSVQYEFEFLPSEGRSLEEAYRFVEREIERAEENYGASAFSDYYAGLSIFERYRSFEEFSAEAESVWQENPQAECGGLDAYTLSERCYHTVSLHALQSGGSRVRITYDTPIIRRIGRENSLPE